MPSPHDHLLPMIYGQALEAPNDSKFCVSRTIPRRHESTASGRCAKQNGLMKKSMQQSLGELGRLGVRETKSDDHGKSHLERIE